ncbi:unnamed protein product [Closterium sp. Naga37s-1]|nr:unnamed protein product [Closterium sp. Naga37s-1]
MLDPFAHSPLISPVHPSHPSAPTGSCAREEAGSAPTQQTGRPSSSKAECACPPTPAAAEASGSWGTVEGRGSGAKKGVWRLRGRGSMEVGEEGSMPRKQRQRRAAAAGEQWRGEEGVDQRKLCGGRSRGGESRSGAEEGSGGGEQGRGEDVGRRGGGEQRMASRGRSVEVSGAHLAFLAVPSTIWSHTKGPHLNAGFTWSEEGEGAARAHQEASLCIIPPFHSLQHGGQRGDDTAAGTDGGEVLFHRCSEADSCREEGEGAARGSKRRLFNPPLPFPSAWRAARRRHGGRHGRRSTRVERRARGQRGGAARGVSLIPPFHSLQHGGQRGDDTAGGTDGGRLVGRGGRGGSALAARGVSLIPPFLPFRSTRGARRARGQRAGSKRRLSNPPLPFPSGRLVGRGGRGGNALAARGVSLIPPFHSLQVDSSTRGARRARGQRAGSKRRLSNPPLQFPSGRLVGRGGRGGNALAARGVSLIPPFLPFSMAGSAEGDTAGGTAGGTDGGSKTQDRLRLRHRCCAAGVADGVGTDASRA